MFNTLPLFMIPLQLLSADANVNGQLSQPTLTGDLGTAVFYCPDCDVYVHHAGTV